MDAKRVGDLQRLCRDVDVFFYTTRQGANAAVFNGAGDGLDGFKITRRRDREACFHDINTHALKGQGNLQLLFRAQAGL